MERKRRERINTSLNDLASLLTEARMVQPDAGGRPAKLEKADILELTVKHIKTLKEKGCDADLLKETKKAVKKENKMEEEEDEEEEEKEEGVEERKRSPVEGRYLAGFRRCMSLVAEELQEAGKEALKETLLDHLGTCLVNLQPRTPTTQNHPTNTHAHAHAHALSTVKGADSANPSSASGKEDSTASQGTCLTLTPTRLSTGVLAFVVHGPIDPALLMPPSRPHSPSPIDTQETVTQPRSSTSSSNQCQPSQRPPALTTPTPTPTPTSTHEVSTSTHGTTHSVTPYLTPSIHPTPPPSVSPSPPHLVDEMEVDEEGLVEDITQPFDLSLRRMWRPW